MTSGGATVTTELSLPIGTTDRVVSRLFPEESQYVKDPVMWVTERLRETLWSKQRDILTSVRDNRYTAVQSAHDTGKSFVASRAAAWWIDAHAPGDAFVVSTAPSQTQVEAILWREIGRAHRRGGLAGRITAGMVPQWKFGQEIVGFGRKPQDLANKEEAMAAFQGIHAKYVLVVIDEAGGVPKWLFDAVDSLATNQSARVLAIGNPDDPGTQFAKVCGPGSGWTTHRISAFDTPAYTGEDVPLELLDLLVSPEWVDERKARWGETSPLYIAKVLGLFPEVSDDMLMPPALIKQCQANDLSGAAIKDKGHYGLDVARSGSDETAAYRSRGGMIRHEWHEHGADTMKTADKMYPFLKAHNGAVSAHVDAIGIGAGVYDRLVQRGMPVFEFVASERAIDSKRFGNRRAEVFWQFREDAENGNIDLPPDGEDDDLISQLGSIKWKISAGKIYMEAKEDMKKRGLPSPDRADAAVMANMRPPAMGLPELPDDEPSTSLTADLLDKVT